MSTVDVDVEGLFDRLSVAGFGDTHEFVAGDIGKLVNIHSDLHEIIPETDSPVGGSVTWGLYSASVAAFKGTLALWVELGQIASPTNGDEYFIVQDGAFYTFNNGFWNVTPHPTGSMVPFSYPNADRCGERAAVDGDGDGQPRGHRILRRRERGGCLHHDRLCAELRRHDPLPLAAVAPGHRSD